MNRKEGSLELLRYEARRSPSTSIHLAAYLQEKARTMLVDGDPNRSASVWAACGSLPFAVADHTTADASGYARVVFDTHPRRRPARGN